MKLSHFVPFSRSQVAIKLVERSSVAEFFEVQEVFIWSYKAYFNEKSEYFDKSIGWKCTYLKEMEGDKSTPQGK